MTEIKLTRALVMTLLVIGGLGALLIALYFALLFPVLAIAVLAAPVDRAGTFVHWVGLPLLYLCVFGVALIRGLSYLRNRKAEEQPVVMTLDFVMLLLPIALLLLSPVVYPELIGRRSAAPTPPPQVQFQLPAAQPVEPTATTVADPLAIARPAETADQQLARRERIQECVRTTFSTWQERQSPLPDTATQAAKIRSIRTDCETGRLSTVRP